MQTPVSQQQRQIQQKKLAAFKQSRIVQDVNQPKIDQLHGIIDYYQLSPDPVALARAESYIKQFAPEAIAESVKAFLKAVKRDPNRKNLHYFLGILRNVQKNSMLIPTQSVAGRDTTANSWWKTNAAVRRCFRPTSPQQ